MVCFFLCFIIKFLAKKKRILRFLKCLYQFLPDFYLNKQKINNFFTKTSLKIMKSFMIVKNVSCWYCCLPDLCTFIFSSLKYWIQYWLAQYKQKIAAVPKQKKHKIYFEFHFLLILIIISFFFCFLPPTTTRKRFI